MFTNLLKTAFSHHPFVLSAKAASAAFENLQSVLPRFVATLSETKRWEGGYWCIGILVIGNPPRFSSILPKTNQGEFGNGQWALRYAVGCTPRTLSRAMHRFWWARPTPQAMATTGEFSASLVERESNATQGECYE